MLTQSFGDIEEELVNKADTVTALEFHPNGRYLATGDMGGRIVLLSRNSEESSSGSGSRVDRDTDDASEGQYWNPYFQFQSHEPEFDYLKSIDIAEKINKIKFIETGTESRLKILSANEKSIKLWNISDKPKYQAANSSRIESKGIDSADNLTFPRKITRSKSNVGISNTTYASLKKNFDNAHNYHIHSLSLCNDGESFLSGDDLTINIWNFERSESCYNIVDIKPDNMDDLTMVITAAKYHPLHCNLVAASTSCGTVHLVDLRKFSTIDTSEINKCPDSSDNFGIFSPSALSPPRNLLLRRDDSGIENLNALDESQKYVKHTTPMSLDEAKGYFASRFMKSSSDFDYPSGSSTSFTSDVYSHSDVSNVDLPPGMSEVTSSISDFCFSQDGMYIIARDYLNIKVWDLRNKSEPVSTIRVNEYLRPSISPLYEMNCTFDKFDISISPNGQKLFSGSYSNRFSIYNRTGDVLHNLMLPSKSEFSPNENTNSFAAGNSIEVSSPVNGVGSNSNSISRSFGGDVSSLQRRNSLQDSNSEDELSSSPRSFIGKLQSSVNGLVQGIKSFKLSYTGPQSKPFELRVDQKVLHSAWHPNGDLVAVAGQSGLFIYKT